MSQGTLPLGAPASPTSPALSQPGAPNSVGANAFQHPLEQLAEVAVSRVVFRLVLGVSPGSIQHQGSEYP